MDWMVNKNEVELERLWHLLKLKSKCDSKILFRTAFNDLDFLPENAFQYFKFEKIDQNWLKLNDRVGTYTGTYLGVKR
jgi:hypothetical protein